MLCFTGGDQGLLNEYFAFSWANNISKHISFLYDFKPRSFNKAAYQRLQSCLLTDTDVEL